MSGALRFWQSTVISFYCMKYFSYYNKPEIYGLMNAGVILCGGLTSSLMAGYISDRYENTNYRTKSNICVIQSLLAVPIFALIFLIH